MSRVGRQPVQVPSNVTLSVQGRTISAKGPRGTNSFDLPELVSVEVQGNKVVVKRADDSKVARERHGLGRALLRNLVRGVADGFERRLEIVGVGYKAELKGRTLVLSLGYSHPVEFPIPDGVQIAVDKGTALLVSGHNRQTVGEVASHLRRYRSPDAYKGKGVRYANERIKLKAGKAGTK
jgi:large subunit ribosomal protein L6